MDQCMTVMSLRWLRLGAIAVLVGCASGGSGPGPAHRDPLQNYDPQRATAATGAGEFATIYRTMGLAASGAPLFFVGDVAYFATRSPDTTLVVVGVSLPNKGLVFKRDPEGYSASYAVALSLDNAAGVVTQARDTESVRVPTFKEISRTDESVIYHRAFRAAPGSYSLTYAVRDENSLRTGGQRLGITVPRLSSGALSTPEPVYQAQPRVRLDSVPDYLPAPSASYVFGVDDSASVYLESYDPRAAISLQLRAPDGKVVWQGSRSLPSRGPGLASGIVTIPLSHADVGIGTIVAVQNGSSDSLGTRIFVGFGPDLPVLSFNEMLGYLRFFSIPGKLQPLYTATPAERGARWSAFLRATDPVPATPQNEALHDYFGRIRDANAIFASDAPAGWLSDRGMVFVTLGAPSNSYEDYGSIYMGDMAVPGGLGSRVKILVWEYSQYQTRIIFYDPNNTGQWRMTRPSMSVFQSLLVRETNR
jgi:GWxTD domain-containing protein